MLEQISEVDCIQTGIQWEVISTRVEEWSVWSARSSRWRASHQGPPRVGGAAKFPHDNPRTPNVPGLHHQNSPRKPPERKERMNSAGQGKKREILGRPSNPPFSTHPRQLKTHKKNFKKSKQLTPKSSHTTEILTLAKVGLAKVGLARSTDRLRWRHSTVMADFGQNRLWPKRV